MNHNRPLTTLQVIAVIVSTIIGVGILSLPRVMAEAGDSGGPLVAALGIPVAYIGCWFTASVCRKFPDETMFIFSKRLLGGGLANVFTCLIFLYYSISSGAIMREFGEVCIKVIFTKTPIEAVTLLILMLTALSIRRNIVKFSYIHVFYLPFIFFSVLFISFVSIKDVDALNLLPITGNHITLSSLSKGMLSSAAVYQGTFVLILLVPFMRKPKQVLKASTAALLVIGVIYMTIVAVSIGMFGAEETKLLMYPTLEAARSISFGAGLLERFDGIFIIAWVISVYTTIFTNYYLAAYAFRELTRFKDHRLVSSFLLPFVFILSLLPENIFQAHDITDITALLGLILLTLYPFLLWLVAVIRKKGGLPHE